MDPSQPMLGWFGQWFWVGAHLHSAAAHHLWQQQKCVVQMNYPECYNLSPEIVHGSHPCQLQMYNRGG